MPAHTPQTPPDLVVSLISCDPLSLYLKKIAAFLFLHIIYPTLAQLRYTMNTSTPLPLWFLALFHPPPSYCSLAARLLGFSIHRWIPL